MYTPEQIQAAYQASLAQGFTPEQIMQGAQANFGISADQINAALNPQPVAAPAPSPQTYSAPQIQQAYQEAISQGYTPEQIQQGAQQNFGISPEQYQSAITPAPAPANPFAFYDAPVKTDYGFRLNDLYGLAVHDDGQRINGLIRFDPTTGQRLTTDSFYAGDVLRGLQQQGLGLEALQGLNSALDKTGLNYRPNQQFGAQGSNHGIDFDALARGELGTAYDWTSDINVGAKGPEALAQLRRSQEIAKAFGIKGANTGLVQYNEQDLRNLGTKTFGNGPGGVVPVDYSSMGIDRSSFVGDLGGGLSNINPAWNGAQGLTTYGQPSVLPNYLRNNNAGLKPDQNAAQMLAPAGLLSDAEKRSAPSGQPAPSVNVFQGALSPFITNLLSRGGDFNESLLQSDAANLQKALQNAALAGATTNPNFSYLGSDFAGRTTTGPQGRAVDGLDPRAKALADELLFGNFTGSGQEAGAGQYTSDIGPIERLRAAGFGYGDIGKILDSYGGAQTFGYQGNTQSVLDRQQAMDAEKEYLALRPDLRGDEGGFRDFIKDAFKSPVGAAILAGLTGGLGGLGAIGSGLAGAVGGTLTGAAASALGGAAIGGLGAGLRGDNILKGAALGGAGGGLAGTGLGNELLGQTGGAALRGGLLGGVSSAVSGGDVLQGLLGGAVQGGATAGLSQLGSAIKGGLLADAYNGPIDFNDIEANSFPPQEGDTFADTTDYLALTADRLRTFAEGVINNPDSTPAEIDQAINNYERAVELSRIASPLSTEGAFRVDIKGANSPVIDVIPQVSGGSRPSVQPMLTVPGKQPVVVDIKGANPPEEEITPIFTGGSIAKTPVASVTAPTGGGGLLSDAPAVSTGGGGLLSETPISPIAPTQEIAKEQVKEIIAKNPNLPIGDILKLLALLGGGAAAIKALTGGGGGGGQFNTGAPTTQTRYRFNPIVSQYPGDLAKYGETNIGDFKFYRPGLLTE